MPIVVLALIAGVNALAALPSRAESAAGAMQAQVLRFPLEDGDEMRVTYNRPDTVYFLNWGFTSVSLRVSTKMGKNPVGKYFNVNGKTVAVEIKSSNPSVLEEETSTLGHFYAQAPGDVELLVKVGETEKRIKLHVICLTELTRKMTAEKIIPILGFPSSTHVISISATWDKQMVSEVVDGQVYFATWPRYPTTYAEHWFYDKYPHHFFIFEGRCLTEVLGIPLPLPDLN